jgi:phosphohistidine phosphatase SixA
MDLCILRHGEAELREAGVPDAGRKPTPAGKRAWKEIGALHASHVLAAGHEPHLGRLITFLLEAAVVVDLKKGALVRIATKATHGPPRGVLKGMITPKLADAVR